MIHSGLYYPPGSDLVRTEAGVHAQAITPDGTLVDDFLVVQDEHWVHVLNAPSLAATASLLIGEDIADRIGGTRLGKGTATQ